MAHFAKLDENNIVVGVYVVNDVDLENTDFPESENIGINFLRNWSNGHINWKQTSYNASFRKNYAGIGYKYNEDIDAFVQPQPYNSWNLNNETGQWEAPVIKPTEGEWGWDESSGQWTELETE